MLKSEDEPHMTTQNETHISVMVKVKCKVPLPQHDLTSQTLCSPVV